MISPGEIARGQHLTVLENHSVNRTIADVSGNVQVIVDKPEYGMGYVFEVVEVDLPYIAVTTKYPLNNSVRVLDTRNSIFMELKPEFVNALVNQ
jgi:hypothetical protein